MQIPSAPKSDHNYLTHYHWSRIMADTLFLPVLTLSRKEKKIQVFTLIIMHPVMSPIVAKCMEHL